jgi:SAM-dependent methyltransferase
VRQYEYEVMHAEELRHWWFRGRRRVLVDILGELAGPRGGSLRILDYGCGTGGNAPAFASFGAVVGIEPDASAIRLASARGGAQYCRTTGTQLPFRPITFDLVVASDVLEHIEDDLAAVSEIARVLRPGGAAIVSVPAHQWLFSEHDVALHHFRRYSKGTLRSVLERGGLRLRRISYWDATLFPAICLHRMLGKWRRPRQPRSDISPAPWLVNEALAALLAAEAAFLRHAPLPCGSSLIGVAERMSPNA